MKHAVKILTSAVIQQFLTSWKRRESNTLSRCWPWLWFNNFWHAEKKRIKHCIRHQDFLRNLTRPWLNNFWQAEKDENQTHYWDDDLGSDSTIFDKLKKKKIKHAIKMLTSAMSQKFLTRGKNKESSRTVSRPTLWKPRQKKRREWNTLSRCWLSPLDQQLLTSWKRRSANTLSRCWPRLCFNKFWQAEKEDNRTRYQDVDLGCDSTIFDKLKKKRIKRAIKMLTSAVIQ